MSPVRLSLKIAIKLSLVLTASHIQTAKLMNRKKIEKENRICGKTFRTSIGSRKTKNHLILNFRNDKPYKYHSFIKPSMQSCLNLFVNHEQKSRVESCLYQLRR